MRRRRLIAVGVVAVLLGVAACLPYKGWLEAKLRSDIAASGLAVDFTLSEVGLKGVTLKDVSLSGQRLESLTLGYSPLEIVRGNFRNLNARNISLKQGEIAVNLSEVVLAITPDKEKKIWTGPWGVKAITVEGMPVVVPPLEGAGTLTRDAERIRLEGTIASAGKQFFGEFALEYPLADSSKAVLTLKQVKLPWNGGMLQVGKVVVPLFGTGAIKLTLNVQKVSLDTLMAGATGNKAKATGTISGKVPVTVKRDGSFTLQPGMLKADGVGTLTLSPELIPGDNAQVELVRQVLQDFHYGVFSMGIEDGNNKQLSILLSLHGNNPDVYNGREIHLNVHLTGDVIELLTQSVMMLDPEQFLKERR